MANKTRPIIDDSNGNVGISTLAVPTSKLQVGGNVVPDVNVTYSLGLPTAQWFSVNSAYVTTSVAIRAPFAALNTISASGVSASIIDFTSGSNPPWSEGNIFYDWVEHSLAVYNNNNQIVHNLGQENLVYVFNPSAGSIPTGTPMYISLSNASGVPQVVPAIADSQGVKYNVAGVADGLISGSAYGYICTVGVVHSTPQNFPTGSVLWLSPLTSGSYVTSAPTASFEKYQVGVVIASGSSGTDILVIPNEHSYGATSASYAYSASRAEFSQQASSSIALLAANQYIVNSITAQTGSITGSFKGYLSGSATTASYTATCSVAILAYMANTADFALDADFCYSASHADTCSLFIVNYLTQSVLSTSYASGSISASYAPLGRSIVFCAAYTPGLTGPDAAEYMVPFSPLEGNTSIVWNIKRFAIRAQIPETTQTLVNFEKSTGPGVFTPTYLGGVLLNAGNYEASSGSVPLALTSGDKLRFNVVTLGTSQNWTLITEISNA